MKEIFLVKSFGNQSMIKTYILGTGYLSNNLKKKILNSKIYDTENFKKNLKEINNNNKKLGDF